MVLHPEVRTNRYRVETVEADGADRDDHVEAQQDRINNWTRHRASSQLGEAVCCTKRLPTTRPWAGAIDPLADGYVAVLLLRRVALEPMYSVPIQQDRNEYTADKDRSAADTL